MEEQKQAKPVTMVDVLGKPFIQAEELAERIAKAIDGSTVDHAVGFAAVFGALEQIKAQYHARVALKVWMQSPGDVLAINNAAGDLDRTQKDAAAAQARQAIDKRVGARKAPAKAPRPAAEKKLDRSSGKLRSVK